MLSPCEGGGKDGKGCKEMGYPPPFGHTGDTAPLCERCLQKLIEEEKIADAHRHLKGDWRKGPPKTK
jgi:hypothetical protein